MNAQPESPAPAAAAAGRDGKGRFARGNKYGPGNPFARQTAALRSALLRQLTEEQIEKVAALLLQKALEGDLAAIRLVLLYAIGKPTPAVNPDDLDRQELEYHRADRVSPEEMERLTAALMPLAMANELLRTLAPCRAADLARLFNDEVQAREQPPEQDLDEEPAEPAAEPSAAPPQPEPEAAPEPSVLPFGPATVNKRERRPGRAANRGQSRPNDPRPPAGPPSTNGPDGGAADAPVPDWLLSFLGLLPPPNPEG
jgi:hypothetical protein